MPSALELVVDCGDGNTLRSSFEFVDGRYRHSIVLRSSTGMTLDHWNDEPDSSDDDWPASPPIQQLSLESINQRPTLLGVGQAGKSHWSISVETILSDSNPGLKFDLACRCRLKPNWLGSTYHREPPLFETRPKLILLTDEGPVTATCERFIASCPLDQVVVVKYPATFRWSYGVFVG